MYLFQQNGCDARFPRDRLSLDWQLSETDRPSVPGMMIGKADPQRDFLFHEALTTLGV